MRKRSDTDIVLWCLSQELCTIYLFNVFRDALFALFQLICVCSKKTISLFRIKAVTFSNFF